ncbi:hypothetical protein FQA47_010143 [Oryzias melastigma]|uniref:Uncharacterized protein n=1 Tax=Oryzias melastigma TaxID=30732 RepID=A0A834FHR4_ORYME|nr:hypothetical protein FQA47_010143 [Oryzias melastigma]
MSEAIHLSVLVCLLTATLCSGSNGSTTAEQAKPTTAPTLISTLTSNSSTTQNQTTHRVTTEAASTPPGTLGTAETTPSTRPPTTLITSTLNETVTQKHTASPGTPNVATNTTVHTTSQASSSIRIKGDLAANPGLIAIISLFCIVLGLTVVVLAVKCIQSPRSNFERLEDVPMGKVNEESPFALYSK